ncbi:hypothetical protein F1645_16210 (plasmid) [Novacetimonas hansenii]|uniref:Uncharacterized protein n=2 Tax=Novacetimonas hansenii TaxID=436 RepID=A0ABQ0SG36_NOVHA|nr:hypothetical protein [Novacetimonas hansenii]GAN83845.1 hypothetical protein Gaha_0105_080 [Novacetimonas hansenii JCM 7643]GBQ62893.1 hypothetical protein AA0243_2986 [Novacetimonas hansenii NRIC 0243]GEC64155.1 hypothetical protein GHA01_20040 [Novacetimonas hansenii]
MLAAVLSEEDIARIACAMSPAGESAWSDTEKALYMQLARKAAEEVVGLGSPIPPYADVETVAYAICSTVNGKALAASERKSFAEELAQNVKTPCAVVPLVRRIDMETQIAACRVDTFSYHTANVRAADALPMPRFEMMFEEGDAPGSVMRVLAYLGIESRLVENDWEDVLNGDSLDLATVEALPVPDFVRNSQWKMVSAWDTEDGTIIRQYVRPLVKAEGGNGV